MTMKILTILAAALLAGCGLTPKQLSAMDGVMCNSWRGMGAEVTTVVVGGASKPASVATNASCEVNVTNFPAVKP
jgi:hypothetical protein